MHPPKVPRRELQTGAHTHTLGTARQPKECMISNHEEHWPLWNQTLGPGLHSTLILVAGPRLQEEEEEEEEGR